MIRVFDAFSGIGGFRSALERVGGFEIVGWCEIDRFAQKAYKALYDTGGEQFYENIRDIDVGKLADFDLLRCIEDDYTQKYKSVRRTVDSRLRRMIHRKKQSLGMKEDFSQSFD